MNTLSLCFICKNEEKNIKNLLESVKGALFDEIIAVDTGSTDATVSILKKYTDKIYYFEWINDFSAARNFSFSKSTCDYIMWLDADDIINPSDYKKLLKLKNKIHEADMWLLRYEYAHDEFGNSICSFFRERIIRRSLNIQWDQPIHEYLPLTGVIKREDDIEVHHYKSHGSSARNIPMLENIVKKDPDNPRNIYYLGKELFDNNKIEEAKVYLTKFVNMSGSWTENIYNAYLKLASCFQIEKDFYKAKEQCYAAIKNDPLKSETYCKLGEIAFDENNLRSAIHWYRIASNLTRPEHILDIIEPKYYSWLPHLQLCLAYNGLDKVKESALHNEIALKYRPQDARMLNNRKIFKDHLGKDFIFDEIEVLKDIYEVYSKVIPIKQEVLQDALKEAIQELEIIQKLEKTIGWCVPNDLNAGTIRIRTLNICSELTKDYASELCGYDTAKNFDIIVVGKSFNQLDINFIRDCKSLNKKVVCDLSEDVLIYENVQTIVKESDAVVCCSEELRRKVLSYNINAFLIEDAVEFFTEYKEEKEDKKEQLKVYWFGYGGHSWQAEKFRYMIEDELEMKLITIHEHPNADIKWDLNTVYEELKNADIILVPSNFKRQPCKSNNRLTQAMALGKPVVCDPLPAYREIVKNGENGFITEGGLDAEWRKYLLKLRDDSTLRKKLSANGYNTAKKYSLENISKQWVDLFLSLEKKEEYIDVIIPTKNNKEFLEECLKSFNNSTLNEEVYIIDNGDGSCVEDILKKYKYPYEIKKI